MSDLKEKLTLSFYSELLSSFGNDRDFDSNLADQLAEIAIKALTEQNQMLVDAVRVASTAEVFNEDGIINLEAIEAVQDIARSALKELGL